MSGYGTRRLATASRLPPYSSIRSVCPAIRAKTSKALISVSSGDPDCFASARRGFSREKSRHVTRRVRHADHAAGPDFVRVGDANMTLDPLSSQGIQNAVVSGIQAAVVINTLAKYPANAKDAIAFYHERQTEKVLQYATKTAELYRARAIVCGQPFWQQRAAAETPAVLEPQALETRKLEPTCKLELSTLTTIEPTPAIQGDMIAATPTIRHRAMARPLAFLAEIELVPLLRQIRSGQSAISIVEAWSAELSADLCWHMLHWLWHRRIVVPVTNS